MTINSRGISGGWSATGKMKNNGQSAQSHLQVNFLERDTNPLPSKNYTVQFSVGNSTLSATGLPAINVPINPIAEIKWSVEGNDVRRLVSVVSGMSLTGVGESIKVSVLDRSAQIDIGSSLPYAAVQYDVDIICAPGSRASVTQPPTLAAQNPNDLSFIFVSAGVGNLFVDVPQDAGVISTYITAHSDGNVISEADASVTQINGTLINRIYTPNVGWVPLVPGTQKLKLNNLSANTIAWSITYGIDG